MTMAKIDVMRLRLLADQLAAFSPDGGLADEIMATPEESELIEERDALYWIIDELRRSVGATDTASFLLGEESYKVDALHSALALWRLNGLGLSKLRLMVNSLPRVNVAPLIYAVMLVASDIEFERLNGDDDE